MYMMQPPGAQFLNCLKCLFQEEVSRVIFLILHVANVLSSKKKRYLRLMKNFLCSARGI